MRPGERAPRLRKTGHVPFCFFSSHLFFWFSSSFLHSLSFSFLPTAYDHACIPLYARRLFPLSPSPPFPPAGVQLTLSPLSLPSRDRPPAGLGPCDGGVHHPPRPPRLLVSAPEPRASHDSRRPVGRIARSGGTRRRLPSVIASTNQAAQRLKAMHTSA